MQKCLHFLFERWPGADVCFSSSTPLARDFFYCSIDLNILRLAVYFESGSPRSLNSLDHTFPTTLFAENHQDKNFDEN